MTGLGSELHRRQGHTQRIIELFRAMPQQWIEWHLLAIEGGPLAWRTRVADARKVFVREGGSLDWNGDVRHSCYMYRPYVALGRAAHEYVSQVGLF